MSLEIKKLLPSNASELAEIMALDPPGYAKYFVPFEFSESSFYKIISQAVKDHYFGLFYDNKLIGFYMLRGFDQGYSTPAYGVFITEKYSKKGLGRLTLKHAIATCKLDGANKLMLKVHPENISAKNLYQSEGFTINGEDAKYNNLIMIKEL
ncbi:MAG: GNAT family N-acetyltransferase [Bacteroidota bacterium]